MTTKILFYSPYRRHTANLLSRKMHGRRESETRERAIRTVHIHIDNIARMRLTQIMALSILFGAPHNRHAVWQAQRRDLMPLLPDELSWNAVSRNEIFRRGDQRSLDLYRLALMPNKEKMATWLHAISETAKVYMRNMQGPRIAVTVLDANAFHVLYLGRLARDLTRTWILQNKGSDDLMLPKTIISNYEKIETDLAEVFNRFRLGVDTPTGHARAAFMEAVSMVRGVCS